MAWTLITISTCGGRSSSARATFLECIGLCGNQPVCRVHFFTKSFLGDDAAVLAPSSGEERASPRHRAGSASMAWRSTRTRRKILISTQELTRSSATASASAASRNVRRRRPSALTRGLAFGQLPRYMSGQSLPCLLYTSPSPRDATLSRMPSSA